MRAVSYTEFRGPLTVGSLADPTPADHGLFIEVEVMGGFGAVGITIIDRFD